MIIITGHITATNPAEGPALLADLRSHIEHTRGEDGCLFYDFAMSDEATGTILVAERWRDEESLATHLAVPEVVALFGRWHEKVDIAVVKHDASNERPMG